MPGIGPSNPFPFQVGGGQSESDAIYRALRSAVGKGGSAEDDVGTIDGVWRRARARGISQVSRTGERAALQAFPDIAIDLLPYYEDLFGLTPDPDETIESRQQAASAAYTERVRASGPDLDADLLAIDSRLSVVALAFEESETTQHGRAFEDLASSEPFNGGRKSTLFPNFSTEFVVTVLFDIGDGVAPTIAERLTLETVKRHLSKTLPAWVTFQIVTSIGFTLDVDLLDLTALNP